MNSPGSLPPQLRRSPPPTEPAALPPMDVAASVPGSWLLFEIERQVFALESRQLRQVLLATSVVALPGKASPAWPGVSAWNRRVLPVLDAGAVLGRRPSLGGASARLLVVHDEGRPWGLLVDHVRGVHQDDPRCLIDVQPGLPAPWNAVRALLPLPHDAGDEACPVLQVPTLYRTSLARRTPAPAAAPFPTEFRT